MYNLHNRSGSSKAVSSREISFQKSEDVPLTSLNSHSKGWGSCLLAIIPSHKDSNSKEKHQSHLASKVLLCNIRFSSSSPPFDLPAHQMRTSPFVHPLPKEISHRLFQILTHQTRALKEGKIIKGNATRHHLFFG